jgi:hypothetical protein
VDDRFAQRGRQVVELTLEQMKAAIEMMRHSAGLGKDLEPEVTAVAVFSAIYGVAVECIVHEGRDDIKNLARQVMGILRAV